MKPDATTRWEEVEERASGLRREGRLDEAAAMYHASLDRFPDNIVLLNGLGLVLLDAGRPADALPFLERAVRQSPETPALVYNLGNALSASGNPQPAVACYERAIALGLDLPEVHNNLGVALQDCDRWHDALPAFERALTRTPGYLPALTNSANALIQLGRPADAVPRLQSAIAMHPDHADAHWLLSHALLVTGRWPEGWDEYEWRWHRMKAAAYHRERQKSRWHGEDVVGKTVLLYAEQGIGDAVQFARYAPLVSARGASVVIECHQELVPLLRSVEGVKAVIPRGSAELRYDVACPLLSLPSVFRTTVADIPASVPYVHADGVRVAGWRDRLARFKRKLCVGLVWAGNAGHTNDRKRSIPAGLLAPLSALQGIQFVSLQKCGPGDPRGVVSGSVDVVDWTDELRDFADTAALIRALDLVVAVDTAVAHIAGALGVPVWMLVPHVPDWRWLEDRADTPWYPSMRLFRQPSAGDWAAVVAAVSAGLRGVASSPR